MKRLFLSILAVILPWIIFLINDDPVDAVLALLLQVSLIGWIPSIIWALKTVKKITAAKPHKKGK